MKYLRSEKGSTLLLVVITIAILTVLGTTIITMSFMNTNMKFTDLRMKKTLYYSESGIEQVYAIVGKYVDDALVYASEQTDIDITAKETAMTNMLTALTAESAALYEDVDAQQALLNLYGGPYDDISSMSLSEFMSSGLYLKALLYDDVNGPGSEYTGYANTFLKLETKKLDGTKVEVNVEDGSGTVGNNGPHQILVDTVEIAEYSKDRMNFHFKNYFNDPIVQSDLKSDIETVYVYLDDADVDSGASVSIVPTRGYGPIVDFSEAESDPNLNDNELIIDGLTSTFNYKGLVRKTIKTDLVIREPGDIVPLNLAQTKVNVKNNPLWQYAIVTQGNIVFEDITGDIDGSIYSLGYKPTGSYNLPATNPNSPRNSLNYKGIMVDGIDTDVTIDGDVISESYVQIAEGSIDATLTINNSHVYTNGMAVQYNSTGGTINVNNGNVYTRDDLEMNGTASTIDISGSYYGFVGSAVEFNQTSSVIINSDFADSGIRITGSHANIAYPEPNDGIYIAGVAYINDTFTPDPNDPSVLNPVTSRLYQTGESLGVKGNYIAYAFPSSDPSSDFSADNLDSQTIGDTSSLPLYYRFVDSANPELSGDYFSKKDKRNYFVEIASDPTYESIIKDGQVGGVNKINIKSDSYKYTQGAVFGLDASLQPEAIIKYLNPAINIDYLENEIARDYVYIMNTLRHRQEGTYVSNFYSDKDNDNVAEFIKNSDIADVIRKYSEVEKVDYSFNPSANLAENVQGPGPGPGKEVAIVRSVTSGAADDNFLIAGAGSGIVANDGDLISYDMDGDPSTPNENAYVINADPDNQIVQGLILTSGKVTIVGNVNYYGSIVAIEDIHLLDGVINLVNNNIDVRKYLARLVLVNPNLRDALDVDTSVSLGIEMEDYEFIEDVIIGNGNIDALRQNYNEFIYYQNWTIKE